MKKLTLIFIVSLVPLFSIAETITYELYSVSQDGTRTLITKGEKTYTVNDVVVQEYSFSSSRYWSKTLSITQGFSIVANIHREKTLDGFALQLLLQPQWYEFWKGYGFSWDWFYKEKDNIFSKLKGSGRLKVSVRREDNSEEATAVEFIEDTTLRLNDSPWFLYSFKDTHHMVIKKGSIFNFKTAPSTLPEYK